MYTILGECFAHCVLILFFTGCVVELVLSLALDNNRDSFLYFFLLSGVRDV